jgi:flavin reductase (DIM6/NTAB) family NADH-FMN oxidoreductase RutF
MSDILKNKKINTDSGSARKLVDIPFDELKLKSIDIWENQWFLLTSGDFEKQHFNTMTVAWGSFGLMWNKPFVQVVVRPVRYTYEYIEKYQTFTLSAFSKEYTDALNLLGTKSGRDGDKIAEAGLTPVASHGIPAPGFAEAELLIECRKIYWDDFEPRHFLDCTIDDNYPQKDYHRIYFGEIVNIRGIETYRINRD